MQTISKKILSTQGIGLLFASSLLLLTGCSTKHQQVGYVSGYYPSNQSRSSVDRYSIPDPDRVTGSSAMHRATLRSYTVFGKRYHPQIVPIGTVEYGVASWYGPDFHGKKTSSGEIYDMYAPGTAAHKTLPMNTIVKVTHRNTGESVKVRINDRGPFVEGRIIDLSYTAGKAIGLDKTGIAPVTLEVLEYDEHIAQLAGGSEVRVARQEPREEIKPQVIAVAAASVSSSSGSDTAKGNYSIQLGAFRNPDSAKRLKESAKSSSGKQVEIKVVEVGDEKLHRVLINGFDTKEEALRFKQDQGLTSAVVVSAS